LSANYLENGYGKDKPERTIGHYDNLKKARKQCTHNEIVFIEVAIQGSAGTIFVLCTLFFNSTNNQFYGK
jgi:hypothetical protein